MSERNGHGRQRPELQTMRGRANSSRQPAGQPGLGGFRQNVEPMRPKSGLRAVASALVEGRVREHGASDAVERLNAAIDAILTEVERDLLVRRLSVGMQSEQSRPAVRRRVDSDQPAPEPRDGHRPAGFARPSNPPCRAPVRNVEPSAERQSQCSRVDNSSWSQLPTWLATKLSGEPEPQRGLSPFATNAIIAILLLGAYGVYSWASSEDAQNPTPHAATTTGTMVPADGDKTRVTNASERVVPAEGLFDKVDDRMDRASGAPPLKVAPVAQGTRNTDVERTSAPTDDRGNNIAALEPEDRDNTVFASDGLGGIAIGLVGAPEPWANGGDQPALATQHSVVTTTPAREKAADSQ